MSVATCRCGHELSAPGPHPCHGNGYTCRKPAVRRFYNTQTLCLSGTTFKLGATETWACDDCWATFNLVRRTK